MIIYRAYFMFGSEAKDADAECLEDFSKGFWLNEKHEFTKGDDCKFWIPSSMILYVKKIKNDD
jgi:hypothetical protein